MPQNLYLIGFMGCGKSRVGKLLARRLRRPFVDMDEQFAKEHDGITAGEFIRAYGEDAFRKEEQLLLSKLSNNQLFTIISTGGGAPTYSGNLELMKNSGKVVFLDAPLEVIEQRLSAVETADRPLWSA
ncbi:MAG: shikimate kinase, partial [Victivallales bacterium]|nr:shikimate kinase [Victivallales bacterium]